MLLRAHTFVFRYFFGIFCCLVFAAFASAQLTTVSGTVTDVNLIPYVNGSIKMQLVINGAAVSGQPTVTLSNQAQCVSSGFGSAPCQVPFQGTVGPFALSSTGSFTVNLQDNTLVTPVGTQWLFTVTIAPGELPPVGFGPQTCIAPITISGASQSVSVALSAACPALTRLSSTTGVGGGAGVTSFSYAQTGLDQVISGAVSTPSTTPLLTLTAQPTQPGFALMGPVPTPSGTNPSFETSVVNAATASTTVTVSGTPANAPTAAIFTVFCSDGSHAVAPTPGTWSTIDNSVNLINGAIYASNLATGARISPSTACTSSSTWVSSIGFFGGSFSSVPHSATINTSCGVTCYTGTLGPLTAGNLILVVAEYASSTTNVSNPTVTDSAGNTYIKVATAFQPSASGIGHFIFVAQFVAIGTPTITVNGNEITTGLNVRAYEISGLTSFYSGPNGPYTFRQITQNDIVGTPLLWANLLPGTNASSGTFAQTGGTVDFSGSTAFKNPVSAGAAPTADGALATNSSTHTLNFGSNGATVNVAAASTGAAGTGTTCAAGSAVTAVSTTAAPTCTALIGSGTGGVSISNQQFTSLGANVNVGNSATTVMSLSVTMPASGCPCRVRIDYGLYLTFPNTNVSAWAFWTNDGTAGSTHTMASLQTGQSNAATGARTSANAGGYSQVTYANGANVTFTLFGQGTGATTMTVEAAPQVGSGTNSWMQAIVQTSN